MVVVMVVVLVVVVVVVVVASSAIESVSRFFLVPRVRLQAHPLRHLPFGSSARVHRGQVPMTVVGFIFSNSACIADAFFRATSSPEA